MARNEIQKLTDDEVRERFPHVLRVSKVGLVSAVRQGKDALILEVQPVPSVHGESASLGCWTDRKTLVEFARYVLLHLEPTLDEQILETLKRIETALTDKS